MKYPRLLLLSIISWLGHSAISHAQQDAQFTLFPFSQLYFNPATAGEDGTTRFQLINRMQWQGYQTSSGEGGAPNTLMFTGSVPLNFIKSAIGVNYVNDRLGAMGSQEVQLSYAYKMNINDNTLALGARVGFQNRYIDFNKLISRDPGDPLIPTGRLGQSQPDIALGAFYDATTFYVGASINHLNRPKFSLSGDAQNALEPNAYLTAGYRFEPIYGLIVQPMVLVKTPVNFSTKTLSIEGGAMATWNDWIFGGITYRLQESVNLLAGVNWQSFRLGGAVDLTGFGRTTKAPASFEMMLSYALPPFVKRKAMPVRTPRFRY
ncbi:PorP/SprF family type IX secretion system membrane protein [Runella limosa]|uniref:PorP/SprF family type IX secretion system membrane protein n=1 Tax=Runella limosa TaxID=370978 RepID=UPI0004164108|nr:PorP/SprF family type IX secretion system membrane protein [Runella limosa]